jgi:general secretion pathway protein H
MRSQGFTLIELLIVLVLIGVITGMAMLAIGNDGNDRTHTIEAKRLAGLLDLAEQEAMLRGEAMALELFEHSYRFLSLTETGWQVERNDMQFRLRELDGGLRLSLRLDESNQPLKSSALLTQKPQPQILLTPDGSSEAVEISLSDKNQYAFHVSNAGEEGWDAIDSGNGHD